MSIDKLITDLLSGVSALTEATNRNSDLLERVVAGQEAAMAKLEGATGTTRKPRTSKATDAAEPAPTTATGATPSTATPAAGEQAAAATATTPAHALLTAPNGETTKVKNAKTGAEEDTPTANFRAADFSRDQVKAEFIGWLGETTDKDERAARAGFVKAIGEHFGVALPFHPENGLVDDEQRKQTLFYLRRKREGLKVDFGAEYNFDGDPLADQSVEADDEVDPLG